MRLRSLRPLGYDATMLTMLENNEYFCIRYVMNWGMARLRWCGSISLLDVALRHWAVYIGMNGCHFGIRCPFYNMSMIHTQRFDRFEYTIRLVSADCMDIGVKAVCVLCWSPEEQERADSPGPSCVSMKSDHSMHVPVTFKDGRPSREER